MQFLSKEGRCANVVWFFDWVCISIILVSNLGFVFALPYMASPITIIVNELMCSPHCHHCDPVTTPKEVPKQSTSWPHYPRAPVGSLTIVASPAAEASWGWRFLIAGSLLWAKRLDGIRWEIDEASREFHFPSCARLCIQNWLNECKLKGSSYQHLGRKVLVLDTQPCTWSHVQNMHFRCFHYSWFTGCFSQKRIPQ